MKTKDLQEFRRLVLPLLALLLVGLGMAGQTGFATTISVTEGTSTSTVIYSAADTQGDIYILTGVSGSAFTVNGSGQVKFVSVPDYETRSSYSFSINAYRAGTIRSSEAMLVNVVDLSPVISSPGSASVAEGVNAATTIYTSVAADPAGGAVTYSVTGTDAPAFSINSSTGVLKINAAPDYETKSSYSINVRASDPSGLFDTRAVTINVINLAPVISSPGSASVAEGVNAGTTVYTAVAADPGGGAVSYSLTGTDAPAFSVNSGTGAVTINAVPDYGTKASYNFDIKASDSSGLFATRAVTLSVRPRLLANNPSVLTGVSWRSNGLFEFSFTNLAAASFTVLASTNVALPMSNWTVLEVITDSPPGQYYYSEPQATNNQQRFYRVRSP